LLKAAVTIQPSHWLFELKYDGFRTLARIQEGRGQLISRNGNPFASFSDLASAIAACLPLAHEAAATISTAADNSVPA
jgi:ATP-dependent DNA ligase